MKRCSTKSLNSPRLSFYNRRTIASETLLKRQLYLGSTGDDDTIGVKKTANSMFGTFWFILFLKRGGGV